VFNFICSIIKPTIEMSLTVFNCTPNICVTWRDLRYTHYFSFISQVRYCGNRTWTVWND